MGGSVGPVSDQIQRPGYKRRFQPESRDDAEEDTDEFGDKRRRANGDGDTWSKAERYNKGELDKVQQIPKQKVKSEKEEGAEEPLTP